MTIAPSSYHRRARRGGSVEGPQGFWAVLLERISRAEVLVRLALCLGSAVVLLILLHGWSEPQPFRKGSIVPHGVVARVPFEKPDAERTRAAQERAAAQVRVVYAQDKAPIVRLRDGLKNRVAEIAAAETLATVSRAPWLEFAPDAAKALEVIPVPKEGADKTAAEPPVAPEPPESAEKKTAEKTADAKEEPTAAEETEKSNAEKADPVVVAAEVNDVSAQNFRTRTRLIGNVRPDTRATASNAEPIAIPTGNGMRSPTLGAFPISPRTRQTSSFIERSGSST